MHIFIILVFINILIPIVITYSQWSVAAELPISDTSNWLSHFLLGSMLFIALCCVQCLVSYTMLTRKHQSDPPAWVRLLVRASLCCGLLGGGGGSINTTASDTTAAPLSMAPSLMAETRNALLGGSSNSSSIEMEFTSKQGSSSSEHAKTQQEQQQGHKDENCQDGSKNVVEKKDQDVDKEACTWERGSRALDRLSRAIIPALYVLFVAVQLGPRM